jgi:chromosome segregation ATPase
VGVAFPMGKFVAGCVALFVFAVGFVILTHGPETAALVDAFVSEPLPHKIAWAIILLVPLVMLVFAVWLWDTLVRHRKSATVLEARLDGVRQGVKELAKTQAETEATVHHLTRTDPEDAMAALQRRLTEAEHFAQVQQNRNQTTDLQSRFETVKAQQQALKERLAPVLDTRRSIEQLFAELDNSQSDLERSLAEIAGGDDAVALDIRLKNLMEFVRQSHARCDQIEAASKTVATLKEGCAELGTRLAPFAAAEDGITSRVRELDEVRDRVTAEIDALLRTPHGPLPDHVQKLVDNKSKLDSGLSQLGVEFSRLAALRKDISALLANFDRALNMLSMTKTGDGAADVDVRVDELSRFIEQTQTQFEDIERRVGIFQQLKTKLAELQSRLVPLEADEGGVAKLLTELQELRDRLVVKIRHIEGGEEGDLAARVKVFSDAKRELEDRVASLSDQFTKLATMRKDITGLFDKLNSAVSASSN